MNKNFLLANCRCFETLQMFIAFAAVVWSSGIQTIYVCFFKFEMIVKLVNFKIIWSIKILQL